MKTCSMRFAQAKTFETRKSSNCKTRSQNSAKSRYARRTVMQGLIGTLVIGLIIGAVAKLLMPGRDPGGCLITILLGIAGALVAGYLGRAVGWYDPGEPAGFIASVIGAMLILLLYRFFLRRRPEAPKTTISGRAPDLRRRHFRADLPVRQPTRFAILPAFAALYVIWGSTYLFIRF